MPEGYPWYGAVTGTQLEQGDVLRACPTYRLEPDGSLTRETRDGVLLSHSCDLANDKLPIVQVCPFWSLEQLAAQVDYLRGRRGREDLRRGNLPGYHLLNRCELPGLEHDFLVVDFRSVFGIHLATAKALTSAVSARVRLLPPYREHLAQAFARFFMRVGLPIDVPPF
ncbi:MAG: hypothetical protein L0Z62_16130 [Gemmataceae bacterium]|nr:hypothetical protein [Gemmataceae bacterium]